MARNCEARRSSRKTGCDRSSSRIAPPTARLPPPLVIFTLRSRSGVALEHGAAGDRAEAHAEAGYSMLPLRTSTRACEPRLLPGALDLHIHREPALHPPERRRQRLHDPEVHAVGVGPNLERPVQPPLLHPGEAEVQRQVGFDLQDVLAGAPEIEIGVEPALGVVHHALDEGRAEIAEAPLAQPRRAAEGGSRARCRRSPGSGPARHPRRSCPAGAGRRGRRRSSPARRASGRPAASAGTVPATRKYPEPSSAGGPPG